MARQRKIPFGYLIRGGIVRSNPQEGEAVKYIFHQYLAGASFLTIAEDMTRRGPSYHQRTPAWNKNMVKRILENPKYTGADGYPSLVPAEDFAAVQHQRTNRNTYAPLAAEMRPVLRKTVCGQCGGRLTRGNRSHGLVHWRCQNSGCGQSISINDEVLAELVGSRLRQLARSPHLLTAPESRQIGLDLDAVRLHNELTLALNRGGENSEYIKSLALAAAVQGYSQLPDPTLTHELEQLRTRLEQGPTDADALSALLTTAVQAIRLGLSKIVELELVNGTIITEEKEESA